MTINMDNNRVPYGLLTAENERLRAIVKDQGETLAVRFRRIELLATTNEALKAKLAEVVEAASPLLNMAVWTESAEDTEMVIVSVGTVRRIRATLAEIEGEKHE
jgi:hypothetical protein